MKGLFTLLVSVFGIATLINAQAPNQPTNPQPANLGNSATINPNICATVSDPNGGNLRVRYFGRKKPAANSKFTVIILPDTQYYTEEPQGNTGGTINMLDAQINWILANRASRNIVYVGHLGDCVQNGDNPPGTNNEIEWQRANTSFSPLENAALTGLPQGIPYGISVGNHDQTPNGSPTGTTTYYNQYFGSTRFAGRGYYGGHYGSNNDNYYDLFSAGGTDFLVISFEYDQTAGFAAAGGPLDWAEGLVQANSNRKVFVITHWAMNENTTFSVQGQSIYNRLRSYPNFMFMFGGHVHTTDGESRRTDVFNGNTVHTIHSDYQARPGGGNGLLRIYEFDPVTNKVSVKTYSPFTNTSETDADSEFTLDVNLFPLLSVSSTVASGTNACYNWTNLQFDANYEWYTDLFDGTNATTGPIWSFTTPIGAPLPVALGRLVAKPEDKKLRLTWTTYNEQENDHFEIERSTDGSQFTYLADIRGSGNSASTRFYSYLDEHPLPGVSYYRLKQVDRNGNYQYSNIVQVKSGNEVKFTVRPNPVTGSDIRIKLNRNLTPWIKISIYDVNGRECYQETKKNVPAEITIRPALANGIYVLKITDETTTNLEQVLINRR